MSHSNIYITDRLKTKAPMTVNKKFSFFSYCFKPFEVDILFWLKITKSDVLLPVIIENHSKVVTSLSIVFLRILQTVFYVKSHGNTTVLKTFILSKISVPF